MSYVKKAKTAVKTAVKKNITDPYFTKKNQRGYKNRMNLYKEITAIKKMINAEKQNAESTDTTLYSLGQFNGAGSGASVIQVTPVIAQGVGEDNRKGDLLKICSWCLKLRITNNGINTTQDTAYKFYLLRQPTNPPATNILSQFLEPNPFSGVIDYNSNRDYVNYKDWIVMGTFQGKIKLNPSNVATAIGSASHTLAKKQEFHIRYSKGTTNILNNPMILIGVADGGDIATVNTLFFRYSMKVYYYDN